MLKVLKQLLKKLYLRQLKIYKTLINLIFRRKENDKSNNNKSNKN